MPEVGTGGWTAVIPVIPGGRHPQPPGADGSMLQPALAPVATIEREDSAGSKP